MKNYPQILKLSASMTLLALTQSAIAKPSSNGLPVDFYHKDWQLVCDNTRTCRAAGYQPDSGDFMPTAVLLERKAGANQPVTIEINLGEEDFYNDVKPVTIDFRQVNLLIDNKNLGRINVEYDKNAMPAFSLTNAQQQALLTSLTKTSRIEFHGKDNTGKPLVWQLSASGANAVLLKMDEVQGRLNTTGALVKKGTQSENQVLPALPAPVVYAQKINDATIARPSDKALFAMLTPKLASIVSPTVATDDNQDNNCDMLEEADTTWEVYRLNHQKLLATHECWRGAYNQGFGMWVINEKPPYQPEWITSSATEYSNGEIWAGQKGRGLGDCWWTAQWQWDGKTFVQTNDSHTGLCRGFAGGAFELPSLVTTIKGD